MLARLEGTLGQRVIRPNLDLASRRRPAAFNRSSIRVTREPNCWNSMPSGTPKQQTQEGGWRMLHEPTSNGRSSMDDDELATLADFDVMALARRSGNGQPARRLPVEQGITILRPLPA